MNIRNYFIGWVRQDAKQLDFRINKVVRKVFITNWAVGYTITARK